MNRKQKLGILVIILLSVGLPSLYYWTESRKITLSPEEAREKILNNEWGFKGVPVRINDDLDLTGTTINGDLYLEDVTINGFLNIDEATINGNLYLDKVTIEWFLHITDTTINGDLVFLKVSSIGSFLIWGTTINGDVVFQSSDIDGLDFFGLTIGGDLSFYNTNTRSGLDIRGATIGGFLNLWRVTIDGSTSFERTTFGLIKFDEATFNGNLVFENIMINSEMGTFFEDTLVESGMAVIETTINGDLYLVKSKIGDFHLSSSIIQSRLSFVDTTIDGDFSLQGTGINGYLELSRATISGTLNLLTKKGPTAIFVSPGMVKRVHYAAPTVPLVVVKE